MTQSFQQHTADSYDKVAKSYASKFYNEMDHKPFDRMMLALLHERTADIGTICDLGCGPGQIAAYLQQIGAEVCGIDLSPLLIAEARRLHPTIRFEQGDMLNLHDVESDTFGGIAAFYCIIHIPRAQVVDALRELKRVLRTGGSLLLTFHIGSEVRHLDTWMDESVNVDFVFFEIEEMKGYLQAAGFHLTEVIQREAYPEEVQTRRGYLFARKLE